MTGTDCNLATGGTLKDPETSARMLRPDRLQQEPRTRRSTWRIKSAQESMGTSAPQVGFLFWLRSCWWVREHSKKSRVAWPPGIPGQHHSEVLHLTDRCWKTIYTHTAPLSYQGT